MDKERERDMFLCLLERLMCAGKLVVLLQVGSANSFYVG